MTRLGAGDRSTARRHFATHLAAGAGEQVVELQLETRDPDAVDVGPTDHTAPRVAAGHLASALAVDVDARQPHRCDLVADVGVGLALHEDETAVLRLDLGEQLADLVVGEVEKVVEDLHGRRPVVDQLRVDRHGHGRDRHGQLGTVAVEHRASLGGEGDRPSPLIGGGGPKGLGLVGLQVGDAADQAEQHGADDDQRHDQTPTGRARTKPRHRATRWRRTRPPLDFSMVRDFDAARDVGRLGVAARAHRDVRCCADFRAASWPSFRGLRSRRGVAAPCRTTVRASPARALRRRRVAVGAVPSPGAMAVESATSRCCLRDALDRPELIERIGVDHDADGVVADRTGCRQLPSHRVGGRPRRRSSPCRGACRARPLPPRAGRASATRHARSGVRRNVRVLQPPVDRSGRAGAGVPPIACGTPLRRAVR